MPTREYPLKPIEVIYQCDKLDCGGEMRQADPEAAHVDSLIEHECALCGARARLDRIYPYIRYQRR